MIYLPDVNIWVALTSDRHIHHMIAREWLQSVTLDQIAFCRLTELGLLRLVTNVKVMLEDTLSPSQAWSVYGEWRADSRVIFVPGHAKFTEFWQESVKTMQGGPNAWTDAYLAAFAAHVDATVVTLDRRFPAPGAQAIKTL